MPLKNAVCNETRECVGYKAHHVEDRNAFGDFVSCVKHGEVKDSGGKPHVTSVIENYEF